ncbi:signal recognition particle-docking protein FtsY [Mycoplasma bovis]|uniref:Signal recognition particle receptor FtsY n=1 Tax=Mycoplasmopsis bovis TaxID=28903 RepID=A0A2N8U1U5_MYCBV|nr:signal recognition particle-docking protein FtsY [Mycoplasmopsis bovis]AXJ69854.1 signal recognition particle-docking protein FtsY [Mycoplasmopsis bovis]MBT1317146.1 signal recognition particle-docking protein FtsY [Mycoplasmopsis bovis]MBT1320893.1 signal recognition particle-docking protein FtsY [Mycoplasmopsis bovis]MBT1322391.1 signal recognition particle-docking protein FtsY [Mycoplasmopsis bovis]MBT1323797.1 signal recognition particle-docking protein FtsY [Mycoplasmopsis bovis]
MGFFSYLKDKLFGWKKKSKEEKLAQKQAELEKKDEDELLKSQRLEKYQAGLSKSSSLGSKLLDLSNKYKKIDEEYFDELEEILIMSDISAKLVYAIITHIKNEVKIRELTNTKDIGELIADQMFVVYTNKSVVDTTLNVEDDRLNILIFIGVNGCGKTTSIAKVAHKYIKEGKKVLIAAADTFRAGAVDQIAIWSERVGADIVKPVKEGADPASVVYSALEKAKAENYDLLLIDTAGRLQNKINLMNELKKMYSIINKFQEGAPHECLLVLDATTGQNGVSQAKAFSEVANPTGIILTKMDGTSKGGIVLSIKDEFNINVKYLGLGEGLDDLQEFDLDNFIYEMTKDLIDKNEE